VADGDLLEAQRAVIRLVELHGDRTLGAPAQELAPDEREVAVERGRHSAGLVGVQQLEQVLARGGDVLTGHGTARLERLGGQWHQQRAGERHPAQAPPIRSLGALLVHERDLGAGVVEVAVPVGGLAAGHRDLSSPAPSPLRIELAGACRVPVEGEPLVDDGCPLRIRAAQPPGQLRIEPGVEGRRGQEVSVVVDAGDRVERSCDAPEGRVVVPGSGRVRMRGAWSRETAGEGRAQDRREQRHVMPPEDVDHAGSSWSALAWRVDVPGRLATGSAGFLSANTAGESSISLVVIPPGSPDRAPRL